MTTLSAASVLEKLQTQGFRLTTARRGLVEILFADDSLRTVAELMTLLKKKRIAADKTTVYREIGFLMERGIVRDVEFGDGQKRYERADDHHHHVVCAKCDLVEDIPADAELERLEKRVSERTGFTILKHSFEFFGLCRKCS
jgi:Fe2+ or Zn2+ uptake regulation protein